MERDISTVRAEALDFLKTHNAGVVATVSKEWNPHASAVYYVADDDFNVYFITKIDSRKYAAIQAHPQAAFTVGTLEAPRTLQIEGAASELRSDEDRAAHIGDIMDMLEKVNPAFLPLVKMDSEVVMMWLQPKWIRWGDFSALGVGNTNVFADIPLT